MAITPSRLIAGTAITTTWTELYNVPSTVLSATVKQLIVCNTDSIPRTLYYVVSNSIGELGPIENDPGSIFYKMTLQANETKIFGMTDVMGIGCSIYAKSGEEGNGNYITISASGMELT